MLTISILLVLYWNRLVTGEWRNYYAFTVALYIQTDCPHPTYLLAAFVSSYHPSLVLDWICDLVLLLPNVEQFGPTLDLPALLTPCPTGPSSVLCHSLLLDDTVYMPSPPYGPYYLPSLATVGGTTHLTLLFWWMIRIAVLLPTPFCLLCLNHTRTVLRTLWSSFTYVS